MFRALLVTALLLPGIAHAQDAAASDDDSDVVTRPDLAAGAEPPLPSDDLAECAAMMAVISSRATQRIQREKLQNAAGAWFAKAGDVAMEEGELPGEEVWGEKVASWAGRITSIDSLANHHDWMAYCDQVGREHGMGGDAFSG